MTNPALATEDQLQELFEVSPETTRRWKRQGLAAVGTYTPHRGAPVALYSVTSAARYSRKA